MIILIFLIIVILINISSFFVPMVMQYTSYINITSLLIILVLQILKKVKAKKGIDIDEKKTEEHMKETAPNSQLEQKEESAETASEIEKYNDKLKNIAERYYFFKTSIPIIESLSKSTREYEEKTLKKVFDQFEEIWNESETIVKESEKSMESIFDTRSSQNMGYILNSSKEINDDFTNFLPVLKQMSSLTDSFIDVSFESFKDISRTTKDIEDLAEQVKVISINVRIEAARIKDSGGFKVLGEDITNFADKTTMFAQSTNDRIQNTLTEIENLKNDLSNKLSIVKDMVNNMYQKINPFEGILEKSSQSLRDVINDLNKVSGELNTNLKQSLGNLQYQDVTKQESEHIIEFLQNIEETSSHIGDLESFLNNDDKRHLQKEILQYLDKISTTGNEADKIEKYAKEWGISYKDEVHEHFDEVDDGTFLF